MKNKRIVITNIGTVSSLGTDLGQITTALSRSPQTSTVPTWDFHSFEQPLQCFNLAGFDPVAILGKKGLRNMDNATKVLLSAAELGFKTLMEECTEETRPGICVGTAFGSLQSIGDFLSDSIVNGVNAVNPQSFANTVINAPTGNANIRHFAHNLSSTVSTGFNAGLDALIYAFDHLQLGYIDRIIAGGNEEISYYALLGCMRSGILSSAGTVRPFAANSDGIVMGEGCALFLLESVESARSRNAPIAVEIAGCANGFDPAPGCGEPSDGSIYTRVVREACAQADISPDKIGFIASGGSGNPVSDRLEAAGIASVFGTTTPVTAYKAFTGECYGASGALNLLCAIADLCANRVSGVPGESYTAGGPVCPVFGQMEKKCDYALISSYSCDGNCSAIIIKKYIAQ